MTWLAFGTEMGFFIPSGAGVVENTTSTFYSSTYSRAAMSVNGNSNYAESPRGIADQSDFRFKGILYQTSPTSNHSIQTLLNFFSSAGTAYIRLRSDYQSSGSNASWQFEYLNSLGVWTVVEAAFNALPVTQQIIVIYCLGLGTADASLYIHFAGTEVASATGLDLSHIPGLSYFRFYGTTSGINTNNYLSEVMLASDEDLISKRLMTWRITGAGANNDWSNSYANVDEAVYDDSDIVSSSAADQVSMYAGSLVGALSNQHIVAFGVAARVKTNGSDPDNVQLAVRVGSTNYFSASHQPSGFGYNAICDFWTTNPSSGADWGTDVPSQIGVKSKNS